jgi:integrase
LLAVAPTAEHTDPDPPSAHEAAAIISAAWGDPDWARLLWVIMITACDAAKSALSAGGTST